uniref:Serine racemase n=1 Tax=Globodera rostochiensis TaxID=31243 RepID=A0A914GW47_GLORO
MNVVDELPSKVCLLLSVSVFLVPMVAGYKHYGTNAGGRTARTPRVGGAHRLFGAFPPRRWPSSSSASFETEVREQFEQMPWPLPYQTAALGWAQWSEWSACTRKCGGEGVQFQLRRCLDMYCSGPSARHRICGKKKCPPNGPTESAVAVECALRSSLHDQLLPVTSTQNCSSLQCVSRRNGTFHNFDISLRDGTKCHLTIGHPNLAVCLDGKCRAVGCDDVVGSSAREDQCGVCDGDGSSCAGELFRWRDTGNFSPCDKSCGPNSIRVSVSVCVNIHTERVVPERMCADRARPRPQIRRCEHIVCPSNSHLTPQLRHQWLAADWSDCSATCGTGEQRREVFCVERVEKDVDRRVDDVQHCWQSQKPVEMRKCNFDACPEWRAGEWGACSASCGRGMRRRSVKCLRADELFHEFHCDGKKPAQEQPCWSGISCLGMDGPKQLISYSEGAGDRQMRPSFIASDWRECSASCGPGIRSRLVECVAASGALRLPDYECQDQSKPVQFQPCHLAPCPVKGTPAQSAIRSLSFPFGGSPKNERGENGTSIFRWELGEWTKCSALCAGGRQRSSVVCVDTVRRVTVSWTNCEGLRPQELTRACNRQACTPDWEIGPWSACSHACGGGLRTRRVRCVRTARDSGAAAVTLLVMPDAQCPGPRPGDKEPCGVVDCAPEWLAGHWGQCSASCGTDGEQRRVLRCVRRDALGDVRALDMAQCPEAQRPDGVRLCSLGPCPNGLETFAYREGPPGPPPATANLALSKDEPLAEADDDETSPNERKHRKLTLKVGGFANLYEGTSIKVKCPLRGGGDRRRVVWSKDGQRVANNLRLKVSANGALRIFHAGLSDAGVYACRTADGRAQGNVTLRFKPASEGEKRPPAQSADNRTKQQRKGLELLQRVRDSLHRLGDRAALQRLASVNDPAQIRVDFAVSSWADCHQAQCGHGEGVQVRLLKCQLHVGGPEAAPANVETDICEAFGVPRPAATRPCTDERCPRWVSGAWSDCAKSRCVRHGTALMKRDVRCAFSNGTLVPSNAALCDRRARPKLKRECENANCFAEWRPSVWGRCSKLCGDGGVQMRLLRCVWRGTRKPAGRNCEPAARPAAIRACESQRTLAPCDTADDRSSGRENEQSERVQEKNEGEEAESGESGEAQTFVSNHPPPPLADRSNSYPEGLHMPEQYQQQREMFDSSLETQQTPDRAEHRLGLELKTDAEQKLWEAMTKTSDAVAVPEVPQEEKPLVPEIEWETNNAIPEESSEEESASEAPREEKPVSEAPREEKPVSEALRKEKPSQDSGRRLRDVVVKPFTGWQRWRGAANFAFVRRASPPLRGPKSLLRHFAPFPNLRAGARAGAVLLQLQAFRQPNKKRLNGQSSRPRPNFSSHKIAMSGQLCPNNANSLTHSTILSAVDRVRPHLRASPIFTSSSLNALCGGKELFFKCENLQKTGSFKSRGAMNAVLCALERNANLRGVITHSSGNHGQALAWAASQKGLRCVVVVPKNTPDTKLDAIRSYGAELIQCEPSMESRWSTCEKLARQRALAIVDPHNDYDVMAGQGTVGVELLEQVPDLDAIILSVGGGGLAAGVATVVKALSPRVKVFCVAPEGKCLQAQLEGGHRALSSELLATVADGVRVKQIGQKCFEPLLKFAENCVFSLSDAEILAANRLLWQRLKLVTEPAAAIPLAAMIREHSSEALRECRRVGLIVCGGNVRMD